VGDGVDQILHQAEFASQAVIDATVENKYQNSSRIKRQLGGEY
jgi:hypothetical protein